MNLEKVRQKVREDAYYSNVKNYIYSHFSKTVDDYDYVADKVVMKNDELHEIIVDAVPFSRNKPIKILDLGCGTGHGIFLALKKFTSSQIVGIDFSAKMIEKTERKIVRFKNRVQLLVEDFNDIDLGRGYDAVISAIAIHNSAPKQKKELFGKIYRCLKKGGVFINGDFVEGENNLVNDEYRRMYGSYLERNLKDEELKVWLRHAFKEDMPMSLSEQFKLLKRQFSDVRLLWQFVNEAVYVCKK